MSNGNAAHVLGSVVPGLFRRARMALVRRRDSRDEPLELLKELSPPAKALLRRLLESETGTLRTPTLAGAAIGLELKEVIAIHRDPEPGAGGPFVLALSTWAAEPLRRHPELLAV